MTCAPRCNASTQGARYAFTNKDVAPLKAKFTKWAAEREAAKQAKDNEAKTV